MDRKSIEFVFLEKLYQGLQNASFHLEYLDSIFGTRQHTFTIDNDTANIEYSATDFSLAKAVAFCKTNLVEQITLYGHIDLRPTDIERKLGSPRKAYSRYDNLFVYFFNEQKLLSGFGISFFLSEESTYSDNKTLTNVTMFW